MLASKKIILNQLTSRTGGSGQMVFAGCTSEPATVTVGGHAATVNHQTTNFTATATVTTGTNTVSVVATDYSYNSATNQYQIIVTNNGVNKTLSFDANGNQTSIVTATSTNAYEWDAADRLVQINQLSTNNLQLTSLFTYDGLGRRVQVIEKTNGVATSTNRFLWMGLELCEERDAAGGTVIKRFFGEGEQITGTNFYFARDYLGSVRDMTDASGSIKARYNYDPYGRRTKISGTMDADFGFTGHYVHVVSGLCLTLFRAYDANLGRWLSTDPIGEAGGLNLYAYALGDPLNWFDPLGLCVGAPGTAESFIPIWGSGRAAINDFQTGHWGWGIFNTAMAVSDVFLVKSLVTGAGKGLIKLGSHTWGATRKWLGKTGQAEAGEHVHHAFIPRNGWGKDVPDAIKNQPWNLKTLKPPEGIDANTWHRMVEGKQAGLNPVGQWWAGTPDWAKAAEGSVVTRGVEAGRGGSNGCN